MLLTALVVAVLLVAAPPDASADAFQELSLVRPPRATRAPDFAVPTLAGSTMTLQQYRGTVVFLNFWATWCPPCKEEMPSMERLYRRFKDRGFAILAISVDAGDPGVVAAFAKALSLTFPIGLDPTMDVANRYGIRALPGSLLIDRTGQIAAIALGPRDWDSRAAHAVVETLLGRQGTFTMPKSHRPYDPGLDSPPPPGTSARPRDSAGRSVTAVRGRAVTTSSGIRRPTS